MSRFKKDILQVKGEALQPRVVGGSVGLSGSPLT